MIFSKVNPQHLHEVKRFIDQGNPTLSGIKKIFRGTEFITINVIIRP